MKKSYFPTFMGICIFIIVFWSIVDYKGNKDIPEESAISIEDKAILTITEKVKKWTQLEKHNMLKKCSDDSIKINEQLSNCTYNNSVIEIIKMTENSFIYIDISKKEHIIIGRY